MAVPDNLKVGMRSLARSLSTMDDEQWPDRCIVGGEGCRQTSIDAHCIPRTALNLIANENRMIVGFDSEPPKTPGHWIEGQPLRQQGIGRFNSGKWACGDHDRLFSSIDSTSVDVHDSQNLFLLIYRTTVYLTQKAIRAASRLAIPMLDPAVKSPSGLPEGVREGLEETARVMSYSAIRVMHVKRQADKIWKRKAFEELEYRVAMWSCVPAMAATGMTWAEGPGNGVEWFGENSKIPLWLILLPQEHGQTLVTASPKGQDSYSGNIHHGLPKNSRTLAEKGNNWTRMICQKVLANATDLAIGHDRFFQTSNAERDNLQSYLFERNMPNTPRRKLPNLLSIERL